MKRYSIHEFSRRSGISTDTLRFYEKKHLLKPTRNEQNNYRYYTDYDLLELQNIYFMRSFSTSLNDILPEKLPYAIDTQLGRIQFEIDHLNQKIEALKTLKNRIERSASTLAEIKSGINVCREYPIKPRYVLHYDDDPTPDHSIISDWMQKMPLTVSLLTIRSPDFSFDSQTAMPVRIGLQIVETFANTQQIHLDPPVTFLPASPGIRCILRLRDPLHPTAADFAPVLQYLKANSLKPARDWAFGIRGIDQDENGKLYYISVLLAVEPM